MSRIELNTDAGRIQLSRVRLNSGGYDTSGTYYGPGAPLWDLMDQDGTSYRIRAASREAAKATIVAAAPAAIFYR